VPGLLVSHILLLLEKTAKMELFLIPVVGVDRCCMICIPVFGLLCGRMERRNVFLLMSCCLGVMGLETKIHIS
jgi:hypothetical protein